MWLMWILWINFVYWYFKLEVDSGYIVGVLLVGKICILFL